MKRSVMILSAVLLTGAAVAQMGPQVTPAPEEMKAIAQLAGQWEGSGWAMVPGSREEFRQTEDVRLAINGHALLIEGHGVHAESGEVVHDAMAVISWDAKAGEYQMLAWKANGSSVDAWGRMEGTNYVWGYDTPRGKIRFTIDLSDPDRWFEIGEYSADGENWMKVLEMNLTRKKS